MSGRERPAHPRATRPSCRVIRAAGSLKSGLALTPGSDPESASSFLRGASSWWSGHPVCGPWRTAARNWRWPCPPRRTQQARTPGRPVRAKRGHATFLARSDSAFFAACRAALEYAPAPKQPQSSLHLAVSICSKMASIPCSVPCQFCMSGFCRVRYCVPNAGSGTDGPQ